MTYVDHFITQYAGEVGLASFGLGKEFSRYTISGLYGYVPASFSGTDGIETVAVRQTYNFYSWRKLDFHVGLNIYHVLGISYESSNYGEAPEGYYPIGSIRGLLNLGFSYLIDKQEKNIFYFESGMNDIWITNWISNRETVNAIDHVSLAVGYKRRF